MLESFSTALDEVIRWSDTNCIASSALMKDMYFKGQQEHNGQKLLGASLDQLMDCQHM